MSFSMVDFERLQALETQGKLSKKHESELSDLRERFATYRDQRSAVWEYSSTSHDDHWYKFSKDDSGKLEWAYENGKADIVLRIGSQEYTENLRTLRQTNMKTHTERTIRRLEMDVPFYAGVCYRPVPIAVNGADLEFNGNFFWDTYKDERDGRVYRNFEDFWRGDLENIRNDLAANSIRVYNMTSRRLDHDGYPSDHTTLPHLHYHRFLEACWNNGDRPLFVLVGIPIPKLLWKGQTDDPEYEKAKNYWDKVVLETMDDLKDVGVVRGFIFNNGIAPNGYAFSSEKDDPKVINYWETVNYYAKLIRDKLGPHSQKYVGMAIPDKMELLEQSGDYITKALEREDGINFWGFDSKINHANWGSFYAFQEHCSGKPIIITEWGIPATSHTPDDDTIYWNSDTAWESSIRMEAMLKELEKRDNNNTYLAGVLYKEYCDEWCTQRDEGGAIDPFHQIGGPYDADFPNHYDDREGYGLHARKRGEGVHEFESAFWVTPTEVELFRPIDRQEKRPHMSEKVRDAFQYFTQAKK